MNHRLEIEIVIPVYNEERVLASTVRRLTEFLDRELPHGWRIVIANNRSTDRTSEIAASLSAVDARVSLLNLPKKGRGLAVREAWSRSHADIVSYMDADLSTDLRYFPLLVESVRQFYDIGVASRLLPASRVVRSLKRLGDDEPAPMPENDVPVKRLRRRSRDCPF